ncbi:MAG: serine hydrolase domain-containing protein [Geminicoccaceae bacterium]
MHRILLSLLTLATSASFAVAQPVSDIPVTPKPPAETASESDLALARALTDYIPHVMRHHGTPGLAIAVGRDGRVIFEAGFGFKDVKNRTPMTHDTTFFTGSMAKTVTATAAMQMVEKGAIELDAPVNTHLEAFQIENPLGGGDVTVRHLLTHMAGMSSNVGGGMTSQFDNLLSLEDRLTELYSNSAEFNASFHGTLLPTWGGAVGEKWQYSNAGTATLGYLVEVTNPEGLNFEDYLQTYVFEPLGMESTQHPVLLIEEQTRADLWTRRSIGNSRAGKFLMPDHHKVASEAPAGGMITTVGDFVRFPMAFFAGGSLSGGYIAAPETLAAMIEPQFDVGNYDQGLMWKLDRAEDGRPFRFWHPGGAPNGHTNVFGGWPDLGIATAMHTNSWPITAGRYLDMYQIEAFILRWLAEEEALGHSPEFHSWVWKTSYVIGLISVEAEAFAGASRADFEASLEDRIAFASYAYGHPSNSSRWSEDGYRAGVADALLGGGELTAPRLEELANGAMAITKGDFLEIYAKLGGAGSLIPGYWSD